MNKTKLALAIVCGLIALLLISVVLVGLISGQWPWQDNSWADNYTGVPTVEGSQPETTEGTEPTEETTLPDAMDPTGGEDGPTIGLEIDGVPIGGSNNSGNSGSGSSGSSGNSSNPSGGKTEIDFDDLLKPTEPTKPEETKPETTEPEATEPDATEPEETKPAETEPDSQGGQAGERPEDTDIDVPIP